MIDVVFSVDVDFKSANVLVLVADETGKSFVSEKLKMFFGTEISKGISEECEELTYGKIKNFNLVFDGKIKNIIIAGAGSRNKFSRSSFEKLGGYILSQIKSSESKVCRLSNCESADNEPIMAYLASGMMLKNWSFDKYKSDKVPAKLKKIECKTGYIQFNKDVFDGLLKIVDGVHTVREMVTEPANVMDPDKLLEEAKALKKLGIKITVLDKKDMEKQGMNALLGVAKGSDKPAYVIAMEYKTDETRPSVALVGKGLTFDSGGLCLKPAKGMGEMKGDMTGAAVVIGTLKTLALQQAKANVVGVIGVVENMISGSAQKPGDVVVAMSGKTIEVDNTDAEGRLVLADVLWYTKQKYAPEIVIDFATLTGAIQVALGHEFAGLFSNSDALCDDLQKSATVVREKLWRLPLHSSYEEDIKSDIADIKNVGSGRGAGSITAALFLKHFVDPGARWAHIDIAATEWDNKDRALSQKGATGFGVRLMNDFICNVCSKNGGRK